MNLTKMNTNDRLEMMRKRQAYFSAVAEEYTSFADFIKAQDMWLAIMGIELTEHANYLQLYIQLDFTEYEYYFIVKTPDGTLTVSDIILWQDEVCCNSYLNISTGERADEEDILSMNVYKNNEDFWRDPNDRRNVWDFSYYAVTVLYYILSDYFSLIKIPEEETKHNFIPQIFNNDYKNISGKIVRELLGSLKQYRDFFESEDDRTDDEESEFMRNVSWSLHKIVSFLPWLNLSNFPVVNELSDDTQQSGFSIQELSFPNKLIADTILSVLRVYAEVAVNNPGYFYRYYASNERARQWDWTMSKMVEAVEWLSANYNCTQDDEIPNEVVFGLHAFAEFLIEMNQP